MIPLPELQSLLPRALRMELLLLAAAAVGTAATSPGPAPALAIDGPRSVPLGGRVELAAAGVPPGATCHWQIDPVPGPSASRARLVNPSVRARAHGERLTLYGERVSPRVGDVRVRLICRTASGELEATAALTCVDGDLTAWRPQHRGGYFPFAKTAVGEADEADPELGPGIRRADQPDLDPGGEDDLIEIRFTVQPAGATVVLVREDPALEVWGTRDRQPGTELAFAGARSAPLAPGSGQLTLWVAWTGAFHGELDLVLVPVDHPRPLDRLRFHSFRSLVLALGGEDQVPGLPPDPNHGTFYVGRALYRLGYDVHLYDEDGVGPTGAGPVYDETVSAIRDRSVASVVSFGYSHGGGSTHDLAELLNAMRPALPVFAIPFTSYVDGIENDSDLDPDQENRYPPSSGFHANQYQHGTFFEDLFLDGGPVPGSVPPPTGLDVETTPWGANATHYIVDDYDEVRDFIHQNLEQRVIR